jgi:hypothetical protein
VGPDGSSSDTAAEGTPTPDFVWDGAANALTPLDCGGSAVFDVTDVTGNTGTYTFVIPPSASVSGIPDSWAAQYGGNLVPDADDDRDGISNFDEYRGFIVSGRHLRTSPVEKDLFVHLVNPQCRTTAGSTASLLGGGAVTYPTDGLLLFANLNTLSPGVRAHLLAYSAGMNNTTTMEWVDHFSSFSVVGSTETWKYCSQPNLANFAACPSPIVVPGGKAPAADRQINAYRRFGASIQRGLRLTECLDNAATSPLGSGRWGSPNGLDEAVLYTQRVVDYIKGTIGSRGPTLWYSTFSNGAWIPLTNVKPDGTAIGTAVDANYVISKAVQYYLAMEIGHTIKLTPTFSSKTTYHFAAGTGDALDQAMRTVTSGSPSGIKFYIPSVYGNTDRGSVQLSP